MSNDRTIKNVLDERVRTVEKEVTKMESESSLKQIAMTTVEQRVLNLETRMTAAEKRITDLEKSFITIKGILRI